MPELRDGEQRLDGEGRGPGHGHGQGPGLGGREQDAELIALLMREYESLRGETVQRVASRMNVLGFSGVIAALITTGGLSPQKPNVYAVLAAVLLGLIWLRDTNQGIQEIGQHLRALEARINTLSTRLYGEPALSWETSRHAGRLRERPVWRLVGRIGGWTQRS